MVGRGAQGDPHLLTRLNHYLTTGNTLPKKSKVIMFEEYLRYADKFRIRKAIIKKQAIQFTTGMPKANRLRDKMKYITDPVEMLELMREWERKY